MDKSKEEDVRRDAGVSDNTFEPRHEVADASKDGENVSNNTSKCRPKGHSGARKAKHISMHLEIPDQNADDKLNIPLEECRKMYKAEVRMLWAEVERFRLACQQQMRREQHLFEVHRKKIRKLMSEEENVTQRKVKDTGDHNQLADGERISEAPFESVPDLPGDLTKKLNRLKVDMSFLDEQPEGRDSETKLTEREEYLTRRQLKLEQFEKDVEEVEAMLEKRQSLCEKRSKEMDLYNEDFLQMKRDIESSVEHLDSLEGGPDMSVEDGDATKPCYNTPEASNKARRHWSIARRHLVDKVALLETTVKRYRTQLASASASVTAKDMLIARLSREKTDLQEEVALNGQRIKQLESELSLTLEEKRRHERNFEMLLEELQTIDINATNKLLHSAESSQPKQEHAKKKLLRKQQSSLSFFTSDSSDKDSSRAPRNVFRRRNNATDRKRSQSSSPFKKETIREAMNGDCGQEIMALKSADDNVNFDDIESQRRPPGDECDEDDLTESGSKACSIM